MKHVFSVRINHKVHNMQHVNNRKGVDFDFIYTKGINFDHVHCIKTHDDSIVCVHVLLSDGSFLHKHNNDTFTLQ